MLTRILLSLLLVFAQARIPGPGGSPAAGGGGGPTFVQAHSNDSNNSTPTDLTNTFSAGTTSGNGVVVYVFWSPSSSPTPATGDITDPSGDTFTFINNVYAPTDAAGSAMYLATTVTAGTTVLTFKCSTNTATLKCGGFEGMTAFEIHGGSRLADGNNKTAGSPPPTGSTSSNADVCASFTPATSGDLIVFGATDVISNSTTFTAGTSPLTFTVPTGGSSTNLLSTMEYGTQTSAAAINPAFTGNSTNLYIGNCMGIK